MHNFGVKGIGIKQKYANIRALSLFIGWNDERTVFGPILAKQRQFTVENI